MFAIYRFKYKDFMSNIILQTQTWVAFRACFSAVVLFVWFLFCFVWKDRVYMHLRQLIMQIIISSSDYNWCTYVLKYRIKHFFYTTSKVFKFIYWNGDFFSDWTKLEVNKNVSVMLWICVHYHPINSKFTMWHLYLPNLILMLFDN